MDFDLDEEHKAWKKVVHDFVAKEEGPTPQVAMDLCVHKIEHQLRRYKERVQAHKGDPSIHSIADDVIDKS